MGTRSHSQKKPQQSAIAPVQSQVRSRPFAVPAQPETSQSETPDLQTQLETAQRFGHSFSKISASKTAIIQPKLTIGAPGDKYEQEADRVAVQVVQQIQAPAPTQTMAEKTIQRGSDLDDDDDDLHMKPMVSRTTSDSRTPAAAELETAIQQSRGSGQPLPGNLRQPMEQAFGGADFSEVKVHTNAQSDQLNKSIQARAFTTGQDVFFRQGAYQPRSRGGQELIAHELTHVVQQNGAVTGAPKSGSGDQRPIQREWSKDEALKVWDQPVRGLLWHFNVASQKLYYTISDLSAIPEPSHASIKAAEGRAYAYEEWKKAGWSGTVDQVKAPKALESNLLGEDKLKTEGISEVSIASVSATPSEDLSAPTSQYKGAKRAFDSLDHAARDPEFDAVMSDVPNGTPEVSIGVLDTGVITKSEYLRSKVLGAMDSALPANVGTPKTGAEYQKDIQDLHGTRVAGNAAFGSEKIKLLDVRVQVGQMNGYDNSEEIAAGIKWAIGKGARVITSSVALDWSKKSIQQVVGAHPEILFLTSGGNNNAKLEKRSIDGEESAERGNAMLIGGVTMEGKKHPNRGYGQAVDVSVPSGASEDTDRALSTHVPKAVMAAEFLPELEKILSKARAGHAQDLATVEKAKTALKPNQQSIERAQKRAETSEKEVVDLNAQIATWKTYESSSESGVMGESGVSFGLPIVANIAAKMLIINPALTASDIKRLLMQNVTKNEAMRDLSKSQGMVDPEKCYAAAKTLRK